ncbi:MAG: twin-arginine translocase subunit TatB [Rhizobiaceae bacterium]|nr:twin-arginine translocase subunit TatB [Rhizobiaceae bacterium]
MFDIGWPEMLVVAIVLIVVVGPKDLPAMLRTFGRTTSKLRAMAGDFRKQFDDALKEAELGDVKGIVDDVRKLNPAADIKKALSPMEQAAKDVRSGLDAAMRPTAKPQGETEAAKGAVAPAAETKPAAPLKNGADGPAAGAAAAAASTTRAASEPKTAAAKPRKAASAKAASPTKPAATAAAKPKHARKPGARQTTAARTRAKRGGQTS